MNSSAISNQKSTIINSSAPILVTGAHRTGTTWVGKMLTASGQAAYISEPLNRHHRPGVLRIPVAQWYPYIRQENEHEYLTAFLETLAYRYHYSAETRSLRSFKDLQRMGRDSWIFLQGKVRHQRPLLKDPSQSFQCALVYPTPGLPGGRYRAPSRCLRQQPETPELAVSIRRFANQPLFIRDWGELFRQDIGQLLAEEQSSEKPDIIAQGSLLWRIVYAVVSEYKLRFPQLQVVRHEDVSLDPLSGYSVLYEKLGLNFSETAQKIILESSSSDNPQEVSNKNIYATRLDSRANLSNWKRRLAKEEIERIRLLTEDVVAEYYPDLTWD